jgi:hypothetical protein
MSTWRKTRLAAARAASGAYKRRWSEGVVWIERFVAAGLGKEALAKEAAARGIALQTLPSPANANLVALGARPVTLVENG